jgi:hypothetical protein
MLQNTSVQGLTAAGKTWLSNTSITGQTDINVTGTATTTIGNSGGGTVVGGTLNVTGRTTLANVSSTALTTGPLWAGATNVTSLVATGNTSVQNVSAQALTVGPLWASGKVGIGTTNPSGLLDVRGVLSSTGPKMGLVIYDTKTPTLALTSDTDKVFGTSHAIIGFLSGSDGGSGVGTNYEDGSDTSSNFKTNFAARIKCSNDIADVAGVQPSIYFQSKKTSQYGYVGGGGNDEYKTIMTMKGTTGYVGIGTTTPSNTLDVSGNTAVRGGFDIWQPRSSLDGYPDLVPIRIIDAGDANNRVGMWIYTNAGSTSRRFCIASSIVNSGALNFPMLIGTRPGTETRVGIAMAATDSAPVSALQVKGTITADNSLSVTSDRRIKTDIIDVNDDQALTDLRKLKPKIYGYKDIYSKGTEKVYGFIAQEVKSVLNYSATLNTQYVPNIYEEATVMNDLLIFTTFNTNDLERDASGVILPKLKLRTLDNKDEEYIIMTEVIDDKTIRIDMNSWINDKGNVVPRDKILVYGQEVNDFHTLNKDAIWTVATAALQEVDRQLQAEKQKTATLETTLASTQATLASCQETLAAVLVRLDTLEQRNP